MRKIRPELLLLVAGNVLIGATVLADPLGIGGSSVFGWRQAAALVAGLALVAAGLAVLDSSRAPDERRADRRVLLLSGLELAGLSALAVAQPLFDLLAGTAEFFVVRGSTALDVLLFTVVVIVLPPAALLALEGLAGLLHRRLGAWLHLLFVGGLVALIALQVLNRWEGLPAELTLALAAYLGAGAAVACRLLGPVRSFLRVLSPVPLLLAALFLLSPQISKLLFEGEAKARAASTASRTPVVMVVFDEFPTTSLLGRDGGIDAERYPNFARFARRSTWYRNATTVSDNTTRAVPAMLTAKNPRTDALPRAADHPDNLFTLLEGTHRFEVFEKLTRLCPQRLCGEVVKESFPERTRSLASDLSVVYEHVVLPRELRDRLPDVTATWQDFRRGGPLDEGAVVDKDPEPLRFERFLDSLGRAGRPGFHFLHLLIPHRPWQYLPSGHRYLGAGQLYGRPRAGFWGTNRFLVAQAQQRHLLQTGYADALVGKLIRRLQETGLYDRSLVVLVADHGVSFREGGVIRGFTDTTLEDMAPVPLIVKAPRQSRGRVVDEHVRTVDIPPTIADLLGTRLPWKSDGRSMLDPGYPDRGSLVLYRSIDGEEMPIDVRSLERKRTAALRRKLELFGAGVELPGLFGFGPRPELLGRPVDAVRAAGGGATAEVAQRSVLRRIDPSASVVPAFITGRLRGVSGERDLAIAVNGRVVTTARSFSVNGQPTFAAMIPESSLRRGVNDVRVVVLPGGPGPLGPGQVR